jgi:excisionase family DNA binding protein
MSTSMSNTLGSAAPAAQMGGDHHEKPASRLLMAAEVASLLRVSRSCVYKLARMEQLPAIRVTQGTLRCQRRWREAEVLAYLERQAVAATP